MKGALPYKEKEDEEERKYWEKEKQIAIKAIKEEIKRYTDGRLNNVSVCLRGNEKVLEEIIWIAELSARARGLEVIDLRKSKEILQKIIDFSKTLDYVSIGEFMHNKLFVADLADLPKELDYYIARSHYPGIWILLCNKRDITEDGAIRFYLK